MLVIEEVMADERWNLGEMRQILISIQLFDLKAGGP